MRLTIFACALAMLTTSARADLYVAPSGADTNPGTQERPFATIERARDAARELLAGDGFREPLTIWIGGGTYRLAASLRLEARDSGKEATRVTYRAVPGEKVRLVGGCAIPAQAFAPVTEPALLERLDADSRSHIVQANLKALGVTDFGEVAPNGKRAELFCNDRPLPLARWPNEGFAKIVDVVGGQPMTVHGLRGDKVGKFTYEGDRPSRWVKEDDVWLHGYWFWDWADQFQRVETIDTAKRTISLRPPYHHYGYRKNMRFYAVNALSELDAPGEWYLDRASGSLFLWPPEPIAAANLVLSLVETPLISLANASHVTLRDLTIEATRGTGVEIRDGQSCQVIGCTIRNTGGTGVVVAGGVRHCVEACDIYQVGSAGVTLSGGDRKTLTPAGHLVANNHIHHFGRLKRTYAAAIHLSGVGNHAANNLIHDAPHMAVGFSGNENVMERNEIHSVCQETGDVGVFYTGRDWTVRGNVIRHNFIHDVHGPGLHGAQGVYLDDGASGTLVFGNVMYRTARAMLLGGGRDNVIENNLLVECSESIRFDNRGLNWMKATVTPPGGVMPQRLLAMPFRQPPWSERYPQLLTLLDDEPGAPKHNTVRCNVVYGCKPMGLAKEVVAFGTVADNLMLDEPPGFVDAARLDLRLRDDSPIFKKLPGFQRIPFEQIGLKIDEYRLGK